MFVAPLPQRRNTRRWQPALYAILAVAIVGFCAIEKVMPNRLRSAMEISHGTGNAIGMTRGDISQEKTVLKVGAQTDSIKLKGALQVRLREQDSCTIEAVGMKAIGNALKAVAILGTPRMSDFQKPPTTTTSVMFKTTPLLNQNGRNMSLVSFNVAKDQAPTGDDSSSVEKIRVGKTTVMGALASKISREFEVDRSKQLCLRVMGPMATSIAIKALCITKNMLKNNGIDAEVQFRSKFVRENDLSIIEIMTSLASPDSTQNEK
mmetsp:Transcript_9122/g.13677  ORF Transcript_9122/g.13677 Transcript_9122/m.13677 type:complete len:263 (+) Transcript_9122:42-830(+)